MLYKVTFAFQMKCFLVFLKILFYLTARIFFIMFRFPVGLNISYHYSVLTTVSTTFLFHHLYNFLPCLLLYHSYLDKYLLVVKVIWQLTSCLGSARMMTSQRSILPIVQWPTFLLDSIRNIISNFLFWLFWKSFIFFIKCFNHWVIWILIFTKNKVLSLMASHQMVWSLDTSYKI